GGAAAWAGGRRRRSASGGGCRRTAAAVARSSRTSASRRGSSVPPSGAAAASTGASSATSVVGGRPVSATCATSSASVSRRSSATAASGVGRSASTRARPAAERASEAIASRTRGNSSVSRARGSNPSILARAARPVPAFFHGRDAQAARARRNDWPLPAKYAHVEGVAVHYLHSGPTTLPDVVPSLDRGRLVLLVHAAGGNAGLWRRQIEALGRDHAVVALDLPGHGRSSGVEGLPTIDAYAGFVAACARALALRPFVLVGRSMGGAIGLALAAHRPELLQGLALVCT